MKCASFDNPITRYREVWVDGYLDARLSFDVLDKHHKAGIKITPPSPGTVSGSIAALPAELAQHVRWIRRYKHD